MAYPLFKLFLLALLSRTSGCLADGGGDRRTFGFDIHHRFSDEVRRWAESTSSGEAGGHNWPEEGTPHYYSSLLEHDMLHLQHRRVLAGAGGRPTYAFAEGNRTTQLLYYGFLHYANVSIGTPAVHFLVGLDTGSSLFWVPCDCNTCARTNSTEYNIKFNIFNTSLSSTNKRVPCNSRFCRLKHNCTADRCPYEVRYLAPPGLSTSGFLVEDVLHLTTEDAHRKAATPRIIFGCGQRQTGAFLKYATPNGLFGLGGGITSVPSILADHKLISHSFSMCFGMGRRHSGRISLGDKGSSDQHEASLLPNTAGAYLVRISEVLVGRTSVPADITALVDTGASFTYMRDPTYTKIAAIFDSGVQEKRIVGIRNNPFEYCYELRHDQTTVSHPNITLQMQGGSVFPVLMPIIMLRTNMRNIYCLAIIKNTDYPISIIGQNFMHGLRVVFDRERQVLGWKPFIRSDVENAPSPSTPPPTTSQKTANESSQPNTTSNTNNGASPVKSSKTPLSGKNSFTAGLLLLVLLFFLP